MLEEENRLKESRLRHLYKCNKKIMDDLYRQGFRFITRSRNGEVVAHKKEPVREINFWFSDYHSRPIDGMHFYKLYWEDEPLKLKRR